MLARNLDVSAYGVFVFGFAFPSWFLLFVSLGFDEVISLHVSGDRSRANAYLTHVAFVRLFLAALAMAGLWIATELILDDPFARTITMVLGASSVVNSYAGTFTAIFRAFERLEFGALVLLVERGLTVGMVLLLLALGYGLFEVSLAFLGGSFVSLLLGALLSRRKFAWFTGGLDPKMLIRIAKPALLFALLSAVGTFGYSAGLVLLTLLRDPAATGLFNASFALLLAMFSFLSIFSLAALPMMSRVNQESRERLLSMLDRIQRLSIVLGVPLAFGGWFFAETIVTSFYGEPFRESGQSFRILVLGFAVETAVLGNGPALAATGYVKQKLLVGAIGAATVVALSVLLIPPWGIVGAAAAFVAAISLTAVLGIAMVRRYLARTGHVTTLAKAVAAGTLMLLALFAFPGISLWLGIALGGGVYFAALCAMRGASRNDGALVLESIRGALFR